MRYGCAADYPFYGTPCPLYGQTDRVGHVHGSDDTPLHDRYLGEVRRRPESTDPLDAALAVARVAATSTAPADEIGEALPQTWPVDGIGHVLFTSRRELTELAESAGAHRERVSEPGELRTSLQCAVPAVRSRRPAVAAAQVGR